MENTIDNTASDKKQKLTQKQRWSIVSDFIRKTDAAELVIIKTLSHEPSDDISIESFDELTVMAINSVLNRDADVADIEDVADMVAHRVDNAFKLAQKFAKVMTGKQQSILTQVLMNAAKSKQHAKAALTTLQREV